MRPTKQITDQHITIELTKGEAKTLLRHLQPLLTKIHMELLLPRTPAQNAAVEINRLTQDEITLHRLIEIIKNFQNTQLPNEDKP